MQDGGRTRQRTPCLKYHSRYCTALSVSLLTQKMQSGYLQPVQGGRGWEGRSLVSGGRSSSYSPPAVRMIWENVVVASRTLTKLVSLAREQDARPELAGPVVAQTAGDSGDYGARRKTMKYSY